MWCRMGTDAKVTPEGPHAVTPPFLSIGKELELGHRKISGRSEK